MVFSLPINLEVLQHRRLQNSPVSVILQAPNFLILHLLVVKLLDMLL